MQLVGTQAAPNVDLVAVGGRLRQLTQSFVGPYAVRTIEGHFADHTFLSIKALSSTGVLTDADPLEAEVKRAMIAQANQSVLLIDRSKLGARGLNAIASVSELSLVVAHGSREDDLRVLLESGVAVRRLSDSRVRAGHGVAAS
jgi:DeoR/GlpR family transcriptional regulator of sugar metabolism